MTVAEYRIFAENLPALVRLAEKLNKRAAKLGLPPITVTKVGEEEVENPDGVTMDLFYNIEISGETPRLNGWEFVATIQHAGEAGNILRVVPSHEGTLPEQFRTADAGNCDHCKKFRRRNDTYIVYNPHMTGRPDFVQVGRNCLVDFVGSDKITNMATMAEMMSLIGESAAGMGGSREGRSDTLMLEPAVAWAAEAMFRGGWISRTKARNEGKTATVDHALQAMENASKGRTCNWKTCRDFDKCLEHFKPSAEARQLAASVLEWAPSWLERELARSQDSDYIWNMSVVLAGETIKERSYGLAASVLGAYQREMEWNQKQARERENAPESNWIGSAGERMVATLTTKAFRFIDTDFGSSTLVTYHDEAGNIYKWFASGRHNIDLDVTATLEFTVKKHTEFNGAKETQVLRVKPFVDKATKAAQAKLRKAAKAKYDALQAQVDEAWASAPGSAEYHNIRDEAHRAYEEWKSI